MHVFLHIDLHTKINRECTRLEFNVYFICLKMKRQFSFDYRLNSNSSEIWINSLCKFGLIVGILYATTVSNYIMFISASHKCNDVL